MPTTKCACMGKCDRMSNNHRTLNWSKCINLALDFTISTIELIDNIVSLLKATKSMSRARPAGATVTAYEVVLHLASSG